MTHLVKLKKNPTTTNPFRKTSLRVPALPSGQPAPGHLACSCQKVARPQEPACPLRLRSLSQPLFNATTQMPLGLLTECCLSLSLLETREKYIFSWWALWFFPLLVCGRYKKIGGRSLHCKAVGRRWTCQSPWQAGVGNTACTKPSNWKPCNFSTLLVWYKVPPTHWLRITGTRS